MSIVVDAEQETASEIEATIEPTTNDAVETFEAAEELDTDTIETETEVESSVAESSVPDKFAGKDVSEIIESYQNLEKELGRKAQEVGELRKLSDSFLQAELSRNSQAQSTPKETQEEPTDFFDDPNAAVNKAIENHPKFQEFQRFQAQQAQTAAKTQLEAAHPDYADIVSNSDFQEWVQGSKIRQQLFQAADAYNFDAANELISNWKDRAMINKTQEVNQAEEAKRKGALKAGKAESRASSGSTSGKKTYKRSDLIRLKMTDPLKYESMADDIYAAYAEGRVK
jgi:hypothetical protein